MLTKFKLDYPKIIKMKLFVLIIINFLSLTSLANSPVDSLSPIIIQEQISFSQKDYLSVRINSIKLLNNDSIYLSFTNHIIKNVFDFKIHYDKKTKALTTIKTINVFESNFNYITYKVRFSEITNKSFLPTANFISNDYSLISFDKILAEFKNLNNYKIELTVKKANNLVYFKTESFKSLSLESLCLDCENTILQDRSLSLNILSNKNKLIKNENLIRLIYQALFSIHKLADFKFNKPKEMIFIFDSISNNTGAVTNKNQIVFHFNTYDEYLILKTITHEMLHWFIPKQYSWLDESFIEYFAIKSLLKSGLISKRKFLNILSNKLNLALKYESISVENLYLNHNYNALYSKGTFLAFLLDLHLLNYSSREVSLAKYLLKPDSFSTKNNNEISMEFIDFINEYVNENKRKQINSFVNSLGILYEENKLKEIKKAQTIKIAKQHFSSIIVDDANIEGFNLGDTIFSLNGKTHYSEISKELFSSNAKQSVFVIKRKDKKFVIKIDNKLSIMIRLKNYLSFYENSTEIQRKNWDNFVNSSF